MKYIHSLLIACAGILLTACSDDDNMNTGNALVSMKHASPTTIEVKENKMFKVPLVVEGEQNGPIKVTVEVTSNSEEYAEDKDFIVTSKTVTIPASKQEVGIEIKLVDDRVINDNERILTVNIAKVNGAQIDQAKSSVKVIVLDNDNTPYDRMTGTWNISVIDGFSGSMLAWEAEIQGYDDDDENYGKEYLLSPLFDANGNAITLEDGSYASMPVKFRNYKVGGKDVAEFKIDCGKVIAEGINFDSTGDNPDLQDCRLRIVSTSASGNLVSTGQITGKVSETFDKVEFDMPVLCEILTKTNQTHGIMFWYTNINLRMK